MSQSVHGSLRSCFDLSERRGVPRRCGSVALVGDSNTTSLPTVLLWRRRFAREGLAGYLQVSLEDHLAQGLTPAFARHFQSRPGAVVLGGSAAR
jgi:hypothetical protein